MYFIAEQMTFDSDPEMGGAVQLMYIIRDLLDPENMLGAVNNKQEKTDFLNYFYKHCMHVLIGNLNNYFNLHVCLSTLKYQIKIRVRSINFGVIFRPVWAYSILYVYHFWTFTKQENQNF